AADPLAGRSFDVRPADDAVAVEDEGRALVGDVAAGAGDAELVDDLVPEVAQDRVGIDAALPGERRLRRTLVGADADYLGAQLSIFVDVAVGLADLPLAGPGERLREEEDDERLAPKVGKLDLFVRRVQQHEVRGPLPNLESHPAKPPRSDLSPAYHRALA